MAYISRAQWGAHSTAKAEPLDGTKVVGIAVHWPGMTSPISGIPAVSSALRLWQTYHLSRGYRDIAYQVAVDQDGNRYELRGLDGRSGANGDADVNVRYGAVLVVLGPGEQPSEAMLSELRSVVADHRGLFPKSTQVVGHQDVRPEPTTCPGPIMEALIKAGALEPGPTPRELMRAELNDLMRGAKDLLENIKGRPRMKYHAEKVREHLSAMRKINRGE